MVGKFIRSRLAASVAMWLAWTLMIVGQWSFGSTTGGVVCTFAALLLIFVGGPRALLLDSARPRS
jgi:hypothetical protein